MFGRPEKEIVLALVTRMQTSTRLSAFKSHISAGIGRNAM